MLGLRANLKQPKRGANEAVVYDANVVISSEVEVEELHRIYSHRIVLLADLWSWEYGLKQASPCVVIGGIWKAL